MGDFTNNFSASEFACKCHKECTAKDGYQMDGGLIHDLQVIRDVYEKPLFIRSGLRCPEWNEHEGGKEDSAHLTGNAVDIASSNSMYRF